MTAEQFRTLALALPGAFESAHMGHPDFRVGRKIFATLGPEEEWGMVKLAPEEQRSYVVAAAGAFEAFNGAWGRKGATKVHLAGAEAAIVREALIAAWRNIAPKRLAQELE